MSPSIFRLRREYGDKWSERVPQELMVTFSFSITLLGKDAYQEGSGKAVT
jgi:hypothetical protein